MSAAHWPTGVSCILANWHRLLIGQPMSDTHCPTDISCSLGNWYQLLIGQLMSAPHWPTNVSCLSPNWCQLLMCQPMLADHCSNDITCWLVNWYSSFSLAYLPHLSIGKLKSAGHWPTNVSSSLVNWCSLQLTSAAKWSTGNSFSLSYWHLLLIGQLQGGSTNLAPLFKCPDLQQYNLKPHQAWC